MNATHLARSLACLTLCSPAVAGVIVIDDDGGPGVDFTDIPPAVAAAQPGDTLLIHAGSYSAFTIDSKPLSLLGLDAGQVLVSGTSAVTNLPFAAVTSLADLDLRRLTVANCWGTLVLDGVDLQPGNDALAVQSSFDVRAIGLIVPDQGVNTTYALVSACTANSSRIELTASQVSGMPGHGWDWCDGGSGIPGAAGLAAYGASKVHLAGSNVHGGMGAILANSACCSGVFCSCTPAGGGAAVAARDTSLVLAMGDPEDFLMGGEPGKWCTGFGPQGCAIWLMGDASAYVSGVGLSGGLSGFCDQSSGSTTLVTPRDPWLDRLFEPVAGGQIRFNVYGEVGDLVTLYLGRKPLVVPLPGVQVEMLTSEERAFDLGSIGSAGFATKSFVVPEFLPPGLAFYAQARVLRGAQELRTNSTPIVVR